mmetsp:Transcript_33123/g.64982  ORF Transcript_33123/g.64982 Transcript_33123/m.64982 type:complete len:168 (+) Transcript_33123:29-532(+)|eukprot:CAMPEP_0175098510 /NCGR_PEP_ID=MMETSP0086_2-20121207/5906_1 /TAXON_ID=136419 /ORGANISM="Unknown Unknown, Strain D1" /LENGTH=167 /DNA_ID=CAMNT_0016372187 /DNA_START=28 /DNA_END=531 /DNA_ORIENTATION=-
MDFSKDYSWSGVNYTGVAGLPTIGTTGTSVRSIFPGKTGNNTQYAIQNRDFGNRWFIRPYFEGSFVYTPDPVAAWDLNKPTYPDTRKSKKPKTPRIPPAGYFNGLERELNGWGPAPPKPRSMTMRPRTTKPGFMRPYRGNSKLSPYGMSDYGYTPYDFRPVTSHIRD